LSDGERVAFAEASGEQREELARKKGKERRRRAATDADAINNGRSNIAVSPLASMKDVATAVRHGQAE